MKQWNMKHKGEFRGILLGILAASTLGNMLAHINMLTLKYKIQYIWYNIWYK